MDLTHFFVNSTILLDDAIISIMPLQTKKVSRFFFFSFLKILRKRQGSNLVRSWDEEPGFNVLLRVSKSTYCLHWDCTTLIGHKEKISMYWVHMCCNIHGECFTTVILH